MIKLKVKLSNTTKLQGHLRQCMEPTTLEPDGLLFQNETLLLCEAVMAKSLSINMEKKLMRNKVCSNLIINESCFTAFIFYINPFLYPG